MCRGLRHSDGTGTKPVTWETLIKPDNPYATPTLRRVKVPGGWLYCTTQLGCSGDMDAGVAVSSVFVPSPARIAKRKTGL